MKSNLLSAVILSTFASVFASGCMMSADGEEFVDDNQTLDSSEERGDELGSDPEDEAVGEAVQALAGYSVGSVPARLPRKHTVNPVTVTWSAPAGHSSSDWVGQYKVGTPNTSYREFRYTGSATSGSMEFYLPDAVGFYEFRYLYNGGYDVVAAASNTVELYTPYICRGLREGDPYYPGWASCCDNADMSQSFWVHSTNASLNSWYAGGCYGWGLNL